jgi:DNA-binding beta-propeller fold protein YncE
VDSGNDRIQVLNHNLSFSSTFGKTGSRRGYFKSPLGIACDNTGRVYVTDSKNHRIQVFTAEGKFVMKIEGHLDWPCAVAVDNSQVYVSDGGTQKCISIFSMLGKYIYSFGKFFCPRGLTVDDTGVVYVCDAERAVQMF